MKSTPSWATLTWGDRMRVIGVDEAGRGPCIGPLFVGAFAMPETDLGLLEDLGVALLLRLLALLDAHVLGVGLFFPHSRDQALLAIW